MGFTRMIPNLKYKLVVVPQGYTVGLMMESVKDLTIDYGTHMFQNLWLYSFLHKIFCFVLFFL